MVCFSCHFLQFAWWNVWSVCLNVFWWISICRAWLSETHFAFCSLCPSNWRASLYSLNVLCCFLFRADYCWHWWKSQVSNRLYSIFHPFAWWLPAAVRMFSNIAVAFFVKACWVSLSHCAWSRCLRLSSPTMCAVTRCCTQLQKLSKLATLSWLFF